MDPEQQDLFAQVGGQMDAAPARDGPLAYRMRPRSLDEFAGQAHIVGPAGPLRRLLASGHLASLIFYGPPGCGKTALASLIASETAGAFERLNAVTAGVKDLRDVIERAKERKRRTGRPTTLFIDEIHRFNKAQQDALLPAVEQGLIILIGATTENPFFSVNAPLVSRSHVFQFEPLSEADIRMLLERALADEERGLGGVRAEVDAAALAHLARVVDGDARIALNTLELAVMTTPPGEDGVRRVDLDIVRQALQRRVLRHDRDGDNHYDVMSAFIKSMRGSDPDATLYWLARMLYGGEDPRAIARRLVIHASEDVGLADPQALVQAVAAAQAVEFVGMPEVRLNLAQAALYIALAPKSNRVYRALDAAWQLVEQGPPGQVPRPLRDASYRGAKRLGHGEGYRYPHDVPSGYVDQAYGPPELDLPRFYQPSPHGYEPTIYKRWLQPRRDGKQAADQND